MWGKESFCTVCGNASWCSHLESSVDITQVKNELPYHLAIALPLIYPKDTDVVIQRGTCTPVFIAAMFTIQTVEGAIMSIDR